MLHARRRASGMSAVGSALGGARSTFFLADVLDETLIELFELLPHQVWPDTDRCS